MRAACYWPRPSSARLSSRASRAPSGEPALGERRRAAASEQHGNVDAENEQRARCFASLSEPGDDAEVREAGAPAHLTSPRLVLVLLWLFGNVLSSAFDRWMVPLLGFFVLPWTTLAYAAFRDWARAFT